MAAGLTVMQDASSSARHRTAEPVGVSKAGLAIPARLNRSGYYDKWEPSGKSDAERLARAITQARRHDRAWLFDTDGNAYIFALPTGKVVYHPRD